MVSAFRSDVAVVFGQRRVFGEEYLFGGDLAGGDATVEVETERARFFGFGSGISDVYRVHVALFQIRIAARQTERILVVQFVAELFDAGLLRVGRVVDVDAPRRADRIVQRRRRLEAAERDPVAPFVRERFVLVEPGRPVSGIDGEVELLGEVADVEGVVLGRIVARVVVGQRGVDLPGETVDGKPFRPAVFIGNVIIDPDRVFFLETVEVADAARNGTVVAFGRVFQVGAVAG